MKSKYTNWTGHRWSTTCGLLIVVWIVAVLGSGSIQAVQDPPQTGAPGDKEVPLVERTPYDQMVLDEFNGNAVIRIVPLKKENVPSDPLPQNGYLVFESPELSDDLLQVPFDNIVSFKTYNQLLVDEANELIKAGQFGKAFRNLLYVYDHGGRDNPEIENALNTCLFEDGRINYQAGNYELALSIFEDIYAKDPTFQVPGVREKPIDVIMTSIDGTIAENFKSGHYDKVASALVQLEAQYPKPSRPVIARWTARLVEQSDALIAKAREFARAGDGKRAHLTARQANSVLPLRSEAIDLYREIVKQFPLIFVGVSQNGVNPNPLSLDDWGARRVGRLTMRSVIEFAGLSDEGGRYDFLNGEFTQVDEAGLVYRFTIKPDQDGIGVPTIGALEIATHLLARGSADSNEYNVPFAKIIDRVAIEDEYNVLVYLRRPFVRPEACMQFLYISPIVNEAPTQNGIYVLKERNEQISVFGLNPSYKVDDGFQHPDIVEWKFPTPSDAVDAIISGEIDVVDRVPLADLHRLQESASIEVRSYIVPTVHMLLPNHRNEFMRDKNFRNGLKRGINRELILNEMILGGREIGGCEVISGPFPIGTEENDQLSYGYNLQVSPQPFNDKLGMVLVQVVHVQKVDALRQRESKTRKWKCQPWFWPTPKMKFPLSPARRFNACGNS